MGVRLRESLTSPMDELRFEPTEKRVRAELDGQTVVDSVRAVLVWEPRRVVPTYAVPADDLHGELVASLPPGGPAPEATTGFAIPDVTALRVFDPRIPFAVRRTAGEPVELRAEGLGRTLAGFRPADADLAGYVVLDFAGADRWLEEDEEISGHPRDPFHRVDVRASSRHVRLSLDGRLLAESTRPALVFETMLPPRYYLPRDDVAAGLIASDTHTWCPYKGGASYFSVDLGDRVVDDLAWSYPDPLPDAVELGGRIAFFDERVDVVVDGVPRPRRVTPWS
jgi:uncharacterized protein (DUF427 family)